MTAKRTRAALYLRVSTTDGQTTENQRLALAKVAGHSAGRSSRPMGTPASEVSRTETGD
jgi:hypothetical protein